MVWTSNCTAVDDERLSGGGNDREEIAGGREGEGERGRELERKKEIKRERDSLVVREVQRERVNK